MAGGAMAGHGAVAMAEFCMTREGPVSVLLLGSLTAARRMTARMTTRMTAPPDRRSGIFIESNESMSDEGEAFSEGSMEILLLMNFVSLTLSFSLPSVAPLFPSCDA